LLEALSRLGLVRVEGALAVLEVGPLRECFEELAGLALQSAKLDYARQQLLAEPLNVTGKM